jgi:HAD superfamily hydrolase (TIGR01509 family)
MRNSRTAGSWPIHSVVFDLDGLLIDTEPIFRECARRLLARRGLEPSIAVLEAMMGQPGPQALEILREHHALAESVTELAAECSQLFYDVLGQDPAPLMPGALELLDRLEQKGIPKAMATSSRGQYVRRILEPHQILHRFAFVLSAEDVSLGKPAPEIYLKAAARFGHEPAEMLVLEDSPNGLRAAKAAGARCVVAPHDLAPRQALASADAIVDSLASPALLELLRI